MMKNNNTDALEWMVVDHPKLPLRRLWYRQMVEFLRFTENRQNYVGFGASVGEWWRTLHADGILLTSPDGQTVRRTDGHFLFLTEQSIM